MTVSPKIEIGRYDQGNVMKIRFDHFLERIREGMYHAGKNGARNVRFVKAFRLKESAKQQAVFVRRPRGIGRDTPMSL